MFRSKCPRAGIGEAAEKIRALVEQTPGAVDVSLSSKGQRPEVAKWSREAGKPIREALIEAGAIRLRPILMTTFALIAGMIPVALGRGEGAQFRQPLGVSVIGV